MSTSSPPPDRSDALDRVQDDARQQFVATFPSQWASIRILVDQLVEVGPQGPVAALVEITRNLSTLAASIGFPSVALRASDLGQLVGETGLYGGEALRAHVVVDAMMEAFNKDLADATAVGTPAAPSAPVVEVTEEVATISADAAPIAVIADDDPDVVRIIDAQMRAAGYETVLAFDGEETLAAVRANNPDILVLDLMMPKRGGFDLLAELRDGPGPRPRIIVVSALAREQDTLRAFELGADDYMTKPFNPQELIARVARLLK